MCTETILVYFNDDGLIVFKEVFEQFKLASRFITSESLFLDIAMANIKYGFDCLNASK